MSVSGAIVGPGSSRPNLICERCSATFHSAAIPRLSHRAAGQCDHCDGPLWPIVADSERDAPHLPVGVRDLETYRRRRRR